MVLVVDPDPIDAKLLVVVLGSGGFATRAVESTEAALDAIIAARPRAIVLELSTPTLGLDLVTILKADPVTRDIVVIAVTALDGESLERAARHDGCAAYFRKPIDAQQVVDAVRSRLHDIDDGGGLP
jgi:CheY-like chemotaxis protein